MSGPPSNGTRSQSNSGRNRPGEAVRWGLRQAHGQLQRIGVLSPTAPGDDPEDQFSLDAELPEFTLYGDSDRDEDSDTVSEAPAEGYENLENTTEYLSGGLYPST